MLKCAIFYTIEKQLNHKNAIVITGMRQVGKTTLMKQLADVWKGKQIWFDFDNPLDHLLFESQDYNKIYNDLRDSTGAAPGERFLVCIDEIQNFPEITTIIKYLIDHYQLKFILTGSSNYYLRNLFPESLSGRKFLFILKPLSFREFLYFNEQLPVSEIQPNFDEVIQQHSKYSQVKRMELYEQYMNYGGFPEVVLTPDQETKTLILKNIFASFFEKDIKVFSQLKDIKELRDLILLLGPLNGNILDITRLSSELGINRLKIYNYLEFLEGIFFLSLIPKHTANIDRSVAGGKKVYFSDTGILNLLTKTSPGQLLETTVANQLKHYGKLAYYNLRNTAEIDFILNNNIALEVKQKAIKQDLFKLEKLANKLQIQHHYIISNTPETKEKIIFPWFL